MKSLSLISLTAVLILSLVSRSGFAQMTGRDSLLNVFEAESEKEGPPGIQGLCQTFFLRQDMHPGETENWVTQKLADHATAGNREMTGWFTAFRSILQIRRGETRKARSGLQQALNMATHLRNPELAALSLLHIANLHRAWGNYDSALIYYQRTEQQLRNPVPFFEFLLRAHRTIFYNLRHQTDQATKDLERLEILANTPQLNYLRFYILYLKGETARNRSNFPEANRYIDQLLAQAYPNSLPWLLGLETKAALRYLSGDFNKTIDLYSKIIIDESRFRLASHFDLAYLFYNLSEGFDSQGQRDLAMQYLTKALQMATQEGYENLAGKCQLEKAWLSFASGDYAAAEQELRTADDSFRKTKDPHSSTSALNLLASIRSKQGKFDEAMRIHNECLKQRTELGDPYLISSSLYNIGSFLSESKKFHEAMPYLWRGLKSDRKSGDNYGIGLYSYELAKSHYGLKSRDSALWYLKNSVKFGEEVASTDILIPAYLLFSDYYESAGDYQTANTYLHKYTEVVANRNNSESSQNLAAYRTLFELTNKDREIQKLSEERNLQKKLFDTQQQLLYLLLAGVAITVIIAILFYRLSRSMRLLSDQNQEKASALDEKNQDLEKVLANLRKTQEQLIASEKMATLGVMSFGVAHELNNPLNFIRGGVAGLQLELEKDKPNSNHIQRLLQAIDEGVSRSARIIQGLRHYSHSSDSNREVCRIHEIIGNCLVILESKLKDRVHIVRDYDPSDPVLTGNAGRFHQALLNLLSNAEQAIEDEGTITVRTRQEADRIAICIEDTGCGISEEHLKRLGDLFFTTKAPGKGTGFGLSIAYRVIAEMGGKVEVKSTLQTGTQFKITFQVPANMN